MSGLKLNFPKGITLEKLQEHGQYWVDTQRLCNWAIGDIAIKAGSMSEDALYQVFPEAVSPGLVDRCKGVSRAYPSDEDRNPLCTWAQHMQVANKSDRKELLESFVEKGLTSDESRKPPETDRKPWILAVDVNYHLHRHWFSGAGVEAAVRVTEWIQRLVARLKEKGLTDVVCCFDSRQSFRKELTADWEDKYKDRPAKDLELVQQIQLVGDLLSGAGFRCVELVGYESDDILASYARQFDGRVTILSQDKDMKQCLSAKCNMLIDVDWTGEDGEVLSCIQRTCQGMVPNYKWLSAAQHKEATGLRPDQWADYQAIWGDSVDHIKGAPGIGEKGAKDLILEFGSVLAVIEAARNEDDRIKPKKREALMELAERLDVVRQLVTLREDLSIPTDTRV